MQVFVQTCNSPNHPLPEWLRKPETLERNAWTKLNFHTKRSFLPFVILRSSEGSMHANVLSGLSKRQLFLDTFLLRRFSFVFKAGSLWRGHDFTACGKTRRQSLLIEMFMITII